MPAESQPPAYSRVAELESRQDDVIRQLDQLNARIEQVLREWAPAKPAPVADDAAPIPQRQAA